MQLLQELLLYTHVKTVAEAGQTDKYLPSKTVEGVDANPPSPKQDDYVELPTPAKVKQKRKRKFPTTDNAENSLIDNIWLYQNADAS